MKFAVAVTLLVTSLCGVVSAVETGPASLVKDIMAGQTPADSDASEFCAMNGIAYFQGYHPSTGYELWRTDGTEAGTWVVKDLLPGIDDSEPQQMIASNGTLYLLARTDNGPFTVWKSDGTAEGTVAPWLNYEYSRFSSFHIADNGKLYLLGEKGVNEKALLVSDGTAAGTTPVLPITVNLSNAVIFLGDVGSTTLFTIKDDANGWKLWKTDGTAAGTSMVPGFIEGSGTRFAGSVEFGGNVYFAATGGLWKSDGTQPGTSLVKGLAFSLTGFFKPFVLANGEFYFFAIDMQTGYHLFKSDGTAEGTVPVSQDSAGSNPHSMTASDGLVYYIADTPTFPGQSDSPEVWRSDGTAAGTYPVTSYNTQGQTVPGNLTATSVGLFFRSNQDGHLYVSDGTVGGTRLVKEFQREVSESWDEWATGSFAGGAIFTAEGGTGRDLWKSDGTAEGTQLVYEPQNPNHSNPAGLVSVGDKWFFHAEDGEHGREPWVTDGTPEGTFMLKDIKVGEIGSLLDYHEFTPMGDKVYFAATGTNTGREIWVSDGTAEGTMMLKDIEPGTGSSSPQTILSGDNVLFFSARTQEHGGEMWVSDGTDAGTTIITTLFAFPHESPQALAVMNGEVYFLCDNFNSANSYTPAYISFWKSNGTAAGTQLLTHFDYTGFSAFAFGMEPVILNNTLLFPMASSHYGHELWRTDGSAGGTVMVSNIANGVLSGAPTYLTVLGDRIYFRARPNGYTSSLFVTDGTEAGTTVALNISGMSSEFKIHGVVDDQLILGDEYRGIWKSDGTESGTENITSMGPLEVGLTDSNVLFTTTDSNAGAELWKSRVASGETALVQDIYPVGSSNPQFITPGSSSRVLFTAEDGEHGRELWIVDVRDLWPASASGWELYE